MHQPDINGTHAEINRPISAATAAVLRDWINSGHIFGPNTSHTILKIKQNLRGLVNGVYITELGGAVYEADARTLVQYHPLLPDERATIADVIAALGLERIQTAAFFPRFDSGDSHGSEVYIHPAVGAAEAAALQARRQEVSRITRDPVEFARWFGDPSRQACMLEWRPVSGGVHEIPGAFQGFNVSYDSSNTLFVTRAGIDKATTFLELVERRYRAVAASRISIAGDSAPTDGPLFRIPFITHIAVGDPSLLADVPGRNVYAATPEETGRILANLMAEVA